MSNEIKKEELLSMEELDNVAGGTVRETALDTEFLRDIGLDIQGRTTKSVHKNFSDVTSELRAAWAQVGIRCLEINSHDINKNVYADSKGNVITRKAAMQHALSVQGKSLNLKTYGEG